MPVKRQNVKTVISSNLLATPFNPTIIDCHRWTEILNCIMFHGKVPKYRTIKVKRLRKNYAWCIGRETPVRKKKYCDLIVHNTYDSFSAFYSILAHELIHAAEYHEFGAISHGDFFYSHTEMLANIGVKLKISYVPTPKN